MFPPADSAQDSEPRFNGKAVYVDITPEATVNTFDVKNPANGMSHAQFTAYKGRVMARLRLRDLGNSYNCLKTTDKPYTYAVWWLATGGVTDTAKWTSHYYLVDPRVPAVTECLAEGSFWRASEKYRGTPRLADWNRHRSPPPPPGNDSIPFIFGGNSTWVSCTGGCCNGR
jgi:hypothetical protein